MMNQKSILLSSPTMHGEELNYINEAFEKNWVAPLGFNCDNFEKEVLGYLCNKEKEYYSLAVSSGTAAIHLALKLAGVKPGERVFCSDMTFVATANPVLYEGGIPVFIDSERDTWNMCPESLEKAFEKYPDTRIVLLVDLYGVPAKIDEIKEICEKHNAVLIEDAAEALSAMYKDRYCGTLGDYNVLSFNGNKIITTSGGGMIITKDRKERERALFWATQARENTPWYQHNEIGYNYRMSNVVAGIGRGQLIHLEEHRQLKTKIYERYAAYLKGLPVRMNPYEKDTRPNFWLSCLLINEDCEVDSIEVFNRLYEENIESRPIWKPMHMQPLYKDYDFIYTEDTPVDEDIFKRGLCLPSDIKMTEEDQKRIVEIIKSCFRGK